MNEVSELKLDLLEKQAKIQALETELATLKGNYKSNVEHTRGKFESFEFELNKQTEGQKLHEYNLQKIIKNSNRHRKVTLKTEKKHSQIQQQLITGNSMSRDMNANKTTPLEKNVNLRSQNCSEDSDSLMYINNSKDSLNQVTHEQDKEIRSNRIGCPPKQQALNTIQKTQKSEIQKDQPNSNTSEEFVGVERNKIKRLYLQLGGVREGVTVQLISEYMEKRGIIPTFVRLMQSKRSGTVAVRVNVNTKDVKQALENDF